MLAAFLGERGLQLPPGLMELYASAEARSLKSLIYWPDNQDQEKNSLGAALRLLANSASAAPQNYLPLLPVDDMSIACVRCPVEEPEESAEVVRWHVGNIEEEYQSAILDVDASAYVRSVATELRARAGGYRGMMQTAKRYHEQYVDRGVRPRASELRPVQLACQNVIIGMASLRQDSECDGLRVPIYLTCEAPHVATNEANRAMAALLLCDAFQNGGTMEVRFGERGKEEAVPPALLRYGRTIGVELGMEDACCISPAEARELFLAVTPTSEELRVRIDELVDRGVVSPERLCYTLMSAVWSAIELEYIVATSGRVGSILRGGAPAEVRRQRLAELEVCRAAVMVGMLQRHLSNSDSAGQSNGSVRVFEDGLARTSWRMLDDVGAVVIAGSERERLPWFARDAEWPAAQSCERLICVPRGLPIREDHELVRELQAEFTDAVVALVVPADMVEIVPDQMRVLTCPDRLALIDATIERKLASLRVGRL